MLIALVCFLSAVVSFMLIRIYQVLHAKSPRQTMPAKTMIILGSGGHTAEMLALTDKLERKLYSPRIYVVANTDPMSSKKAIDQEMGASDFEIVQIPRSRAVLQSYASAVLSTIRAFTSCVPIVLKHRPDVVLSNGPGTCVPIILIAYLMRLIWIKPRCKLVFVESYCRVKSISLSGKILQRLADLFVVQWPELQQKSSRMQYLGKLM